MRDRKSLEKIFEEWDEETFITDEIEYVRRTLLWAAEEVKI